MDHQPTSHVTPAVPPTTFELETASTSDFASSVCGDFAKAMRELARLDAKAEALYRADFSTPPAAEALEVACRAYDDAFGHVRTMPIRSADDVYLKAEFAVRFCRWSDDLQSLLVEIASFGSPGLADRLEPAELFG